MKMMRLLIAALLAAILVAFLGGTIVAPDLNMFSSPGMPLITYGFCQISPSQVSTTPILFAPTEQQLLNGGSIGKHARPKLMTNNWTSSMKQSEVNQMFALLARGIGNKNSP